MLVAFLMRKTLVVALMPRLRRASCERQEEASPTADITTIFIHVSAVGCCQDRREYGIPVYKEHLGFYGMDFKVAWFYHS